MIKYGTIHVSAEKQLQQISTTVSILFRIQPGFSAAYGARRTCHVHNTQKRAKSHTQGFYDRDKLFWKEIADTMLITGAAPPGGGRSEVTPRFVRHFNVFCVPQASTTAMQLIFSSMLKVK